MQIVEKTTPQGEISFAAIVHETYLWGFWGSSYWVTEILKGGIFIKKEHSEDWLSLPSWFATREEALSKANECIAQWEIEQKSDKLKVVETIKIKNQ